MRGIRKVCTFCMLIAILPSTLIFIPLYLRHVSYADVAYAVAESDIMEVNYGISTIFCSKHVLRMNGTFNSFQMAQRPEVTSKRKHIRLKKSMNLPDDTLEYWGFYLLKGATVSLSVCSRFEGASILVVKGERNLHTCGLLEHNINKEQAQDIFLPGANRQVKIIYESNQEIDSKETTTIEPINVYNTSDKPLVNVNSENPLERDSTVFTSTNNSTQAYTGNGRLMKDLAPFYDITASYVLKHRDGQQESKNETRKLRHVKSQKRKRNRNKRRRQRQRYIQNYNRQLRIQKLKQELNSYPETKKHRIEKETKVTNDISAKRYKRSRELIKPPSLLDQGIKHGGNADKNFTSDYYQESLVSSFENDLLNCYSGAILLTYEFEPSDQCTNIFYLLNGKHTEANHHVEEDGYYYYIFYSDNDIVSNDIYAIFDIYKPTFQYENVTESCINKTECSFSLSPLSKDRVIVEIPTKDGIEHDEADDVSILISTCKPRMGAYAIFPIALLLVTIGCALYDYK